MSKSCEDACGCDTTPAEGNTGSKASEASGNWISVYTVPKMDCPSEERLIRLALDNVEPSVGLLFDIPRRKVTVFHSDNLDEITTKLKSLNFGAKLDTTEETCASNAAKATAISLANEAKETQILKWLLAINGFMFIVEIVAGWSAQSTGLIADSIDMFADAAVYGLALYAVGHSVNKKLKAAHISGWLQMILALGALTEVARRFIFGSEPVSDLMMGFGLVALIANVACLLLIFKNKESGAHMKASWIFSANDVIANLGVILAGALVAWTGSRYPDLVIGIIIGVIVLNGARRILQLKS